MMCNCIHEVETELQQKYGEKALFVKRAKTGFKWIDGIIQFRFFIPFRTDELKEAKIRKEYFLAEYCPFCGEKMVIKRDD